MKFKYFVIAILAFIILNLILILNIIYKLLTFLFPIFFIIDILIIVFGALSIYIAIHKAKKKYSSYIKKFYYNDNCKQASTSHRKEARNVTIDDVDKED